MALTKNERGKRMWPSFPMANHIADWANIFFIGSLAVGLISTGLIIWMANVKEGHWERARQASEERIALLAAQGDEAKAALGTAQADITKANAKIASANEAAAHANERAATLEKEAEEARAQQEILKQRLAWRRIEPSKYAQLVADLKPLATVIGVSTFSDPESSSYADDIAGALSDAGFDVRRQYFMSIPRYDMAISEEPSRL
jgi:hypothetical protein